MPVRTYIHLLFPLYAWLTEHWVDQTHTSDLCFLNTPYSKTGPKRTAKAAMLSPFLRTPFMDEG
jgi:hypothetical protein